MNLRRFYAISQIEYCRNFIVGTAKYPGIKIHDTRMIRLMEVMLHGGTVVSGWTTRQIHEAILTIFQISADRYGLNQLRYGLRKL